MRRYVSMAIAAIGVCSGMPRPIHAVERHVPGAYPTIQAAINAAVNGDQVTIAAGVYTGPGNRDINPLGKSITIWGASGEENTIIDCQASSGDPHRGFLITSGPSALVIDGLTIRNGYHTTGGGLLVFGTASPTIQNCVLENCTATDRGGGVYVFGTGTPTFTSCTFASNTANLGGGMHSSGTGAPLLTGCTFSGNNATNSGGGLFLSGNNCGIMNCTFEDNAAEDWGGGGIYCNSGSNPQISGCTIVGNSAAENGGGITCAAASNATITDTFITGNTSAVQGAGINCNESSPTLTGCTIDGNEAAISGGGIRCLGTGANATFTSCTIRQNLALGWEGGGVHLSYGAQPILTGCTIEENTANFSGGGLFAFSDSHPQVVDCIVQNNDALTYEGGGLWFRGNCNPTISGTTISGNSAANAGGLYFDQRSTGTVTNCTITGNLATGDGGGIYANGDATAPAISGCTINGNQSGQYAGGIRIAHGASAQLTDCMLEQNIAVQGGGVQVWSNSNPTLTNCTIRGNVATTYASGGIDIAYTSNPTLINCVISANTAAQAGGGVGCGGGSSPILSGCTISDNIAQTDGGGLEVGGANASLNLDNCIISGNQAPQGYGGGMRIAFDATAQLTNCNIEGNSAVLGGGVQVWSNSNPTLTNCTIRGNVATTYGSGGIDIAYTSNPTLIDCVISANTAAQAGGGVSCGGGSSPILSGCTISDNIAQTDSGGLDFAGAGTNPTLENCTINGNQAVAYWGGGLSAKFGAAPTLSGCTISGNSAGGAGGGVSLSVNGDATITGCTISGNTAGGNGGGIFAEWESDPAIDDCLIDGNVGGGNGGGVVLHGGAGEITDCTIQNNFATYESGGLRLAFSNTSVVKDCVISGNSSGSFGGVTVRYDSAPSLANCTISNNTNFGFGYGAGGVHCENNADVLIESCIIATNVSDADGGVVAYWDSDVELINSLLYGNNSNSAGAFKIANNSTGLIVNSTLADNFSTFDGAVTQWDGDLVIANSIVWGNATNELVVYGGTTDVSNTNIEGGWPGVGNINAAPLFVDSPSGDYRLGAGSPCIDAGDNMAVPADELDLDGDGDVNEPLPYDLNELPRFADDPASPDTGYGAPPLVDMGAYEFDPGCLGSLVGDIDRDCDVDLNDFAIFAGCMEGPGTPLQPGCEDADLDGDGDADLLDFAVFQVASASVGHGDYAQIMAGVSQVVSGGLPGPVYPMSDLWAGLVMGDEDASFPSLFAAARRYAAGRVIVLGHDGIMSAEGLDNDVFRLNMVAWLNAGGIGRVAYMTGHGEWIGAAALAGLEQDLIGQGMALNPLPAPITAEGLADVSVLIAGDAWSDFTPDEIEATRQWVLAGGGLLLVGLGWSWEPYHPGTTIEDYPMMRLAAPYEVRWLRSGIEDPTNQFNGSAVFHVLYPQIENITVPQAVDAIATAHARHGDLLPTVLESDASLRLAFARAHQTASIPAAELPAEHAERLLVFDACTELAQEWPDFYGRGFSFDESSFPTATRARERFWRTWRDALPLTDERREQIAQAGALAGLRGDIFQQFGVILLDNDRLDQSQLLDIHDHLLLIPPGLLSQRAISVLDYLGQPSPPLSLDGLPFAVNVFGIRVGAATENQFPPDVSPGIADLFSVVVSHELNHVVDAFAISASPELAARKALLISDAGTTAMNYLRSMIPDGFFVANPQEFFASIANQWFTDSAKTLELGLVRFDAGYEDPINQALFFADVYSQGGLATYFYTTGLDGRVVRTSIALTRDAAGWIDSITLGMVRYHFTLDTAERVTSYWSASAADYDGDADVDIDDFAILAGCMNGPGAPPQPGCENADLDGDNDVDLADFASFQTAFGD